MISDSNYNFQSGFPAFDEINKKSGTLKEYLSQDTRMGGNYSTYLLLKRFRPSNKILLGLCRFKVFNELDAFQKELHLCGVSPQMIQKIVDYASLKKMRFIYFSRIGVQLGYQDKNVGKILNNFFELLVKSKKQPFIVYLKIRKDLEDYISEKYETIGEKKDPLWGNYLVKMKVFQIK